MSITRMRRKMGRGMKIILGVILVVFVVSIPVVFGTRNWPGFKRQEYAGITKVVAVVNSEEVTRQTFALAFSNVREIYARGSGLNVQSLERARASILDSLVQRQVEVQAAKARGIRVGRGDVKREIKRRIDEEIAAYRTQFGERADVRARTADLRKIFQGQEDRVRDDLAIERLRQAIQSQVKVTDQDLLASYDQIKARHILVTTYERPGQKAPSDAEARKKAEGLLKQINEGADFAELARQESDDPGTARYGGGFHAFDDPSTPEDESEAPRWVKRGENVPEFDEAAFALQPGETSGVVKTPYGYHIIRVEDRGRQLPEDFQKNKKKLHQDLLTRRQTEAWMEFSQGQREKAKVTIRDPELRAAQAYSNGDYDEALKDFKKALEFVDRLGDEVHGAVWFTMGDIYLKRQEWKKAAEALEKAVDVAVSEMLPIYLELATAYEQMGQEDKALEYYRAAADEYPEDPGSISRLKRAFTQLGDEERAAEMDRLLEEWRQEMEDAAAARGIEALPGR